MTIGLSPVPPQRQAPVFIPQDRPVYRAKNACFFYDTLLEEGKIFTWLEEPNLELEPLNDLATAAMDKYIAKMDDYGRKAAKAIGKAYKPISAGNKHPDDISAEDNNGLRVLNAKTQIPLMGAKLSRRIEQITVPDAGTEPQIIQLGE